jgi:hypothetical protein
MKTFKAKKRHITKKTNKYKHGKQHSKLRKHYKKKSYHNRKIIGGSLIGQGNFGCVFRPDIVNGNKNIVSKIVLKTNMFNEYRHEYKILHKMSTVDPSGKFHSLITNAQDMTPNLIPPDFDKCSLSRPTYDVKEFFVFNMKYCGSNNLTYYLHNSFRKQNNMLGITNIEPGILFTLLTNIIVGIKKMVKVNIVHKTLDTDSIYLLEPVSLQNPHCEKIIDFGEGEVRKYDTFSDKYQDYIMLFSSIIKILDSTQRSGHHNKIYTEKIKLLKQLFIELLSMVNMPRFSQDELIKKYSSSLGVIFGESYSEYAISKYK